MKPIQFLHAMTKTDELRAYMTENAAEVASVLEIEVYLVTGALERIVEDAALARAVQKQITAVRDGNRGAKVAARLLAAQASADTLSSIATVPPSGERIDLDVPSLLASCLTGPKDRIVFMTECMQVTIAMVRLLDVSRLDLPGLTGWVDASGLHLRYGRGGYNFRPMGKKVNKAGFPVADEEGVKVYFSCYSGADDASPPTAGEDSCPPTVRYEEAA
jgi:hypothetical protein